MNSQFQAKIAIVCGCLLTILACGNSMKGEFYSLDNGKQDRIVFSSQGTFEIYKSDRLEGIGTYERKKEVVFLTIADETVRAIYAHRKIAVEPEGKKQEIFVSKETWIAEHQPPEDGRRRL